MLALFVAPPIEHCIETLPFIRVMATRRVCYGLTPNENGYAAMKTNEYQIPLCFPDQTCWLDCDPYALSHLVMEKLGGKLFDQAALASFLVSNPVWMLLSLSAIGDDPTANGKCKLNDVHRWLLQDNRLTGLRRKPAPSADDSKKLATKRKAKARKASQKLTKRLALVESADDLKSTLSRLVDKPHRKTVMENWGELRVAKSFWKAIQKSARSSPALPVPIEQQLDYLSVFAKLDQLQKTEAEFDQQLLTQKLDSMRLLAYGASHEINNPLANIATRAQALLMDESDAKRKHRLTVIYEQAMRAHEMISDMMLFAHPPKLVCAAVDLNEVIDCVAAELETKLNATKIVCKIESRVDRAPILLLDRTQVAAAIKALLMNSVEAIGTVGRIDIKIDATKRGTTLSVSDNGPGIDDSISQNIFDPFFSGREAGRGLGFGLSKAWRIFQLHDANLRRRESEEGGATFEVFFPAAGSQNPVCQVSDQARRLVVQNRSTSGETAIKKRVA